MSAGGRIEADLHRALVRKIIVEHLFIGDMNA
jgi:hypothetical protein